MVLPLHAADAHFLVHNLLLVSPHHSHRGAGDRFLIFHGDLLQMSLDAHMHLYFRPRVPAFSQTQWPCREHLPFQEYTTI